MITPDIAARLAKVDLIVSDVDGVLTDGTIQVHSDGTESKQFCVKDGAGAALARIAEIPITFLSARYSETTTIRAREIGIQHCYQGRLDKLNAFQELCSIHNVKPGNAVYVGDGLVDIPPMEVSVCSFAPVDSHPRVLDMATIVTQLCGGEGVLREVVEIILTAQNRIEEVYQKMRREVYKA